MITTIAGPARTRRRISLTALGLLTSLLVLGCDAQPPDLPPTNTMQPEISALAVAPREAKATDEIGTSEYSHYAMAWSHFSWVTQHLVSVVAIPASAAEQALGQDAVRHEASEWRWSVKMLAFDITLKALGNDNGGFDILFRTDGPNLGLHDFTWVTGHFLHDLSSGSWVLYDQDYSGGNNEVLQIDWTMAGDTERTLVFTNLKSGHEQHGHIWNYARSGSTAQVAYEDPNDETWFANITWDVNEGNGSIHTPTYNQGQVSCWDVEFKNIECPVEE